MTILQNRTHRIVKPSAKMVEMPKDEPSAISQGYNRYQQILRTIGELYSYKYGDIRRRLASEVYKSGTDPNSRAEIKEAEQKIAKGHKRSKRTPRTLSQGLQNYHKVLRTVRDLYPYRYQDAQKLASKIHKSGIDSNSEIEIMKEESRISRRRYRKLLRQVE